MTDFLGMDSRSRKLQQEQQRRRDAAKLRIQREKRAKEAAAKDQARYEEQIRTRKLEQRRAEEEARKQEEAEQMRTGGIRYKETLRAVAASGEGDKILLPPSVLESLSNQDAVSMGPMLFELSHTAPAQPGGEATETVTRTTHAGVLTFIAEEGTVGLPRKVVRSLLGAASVSGSDDGEAREGEAIPTVGDVVVKYVRLSKATFARVVPETVGLSQVSELRAMLEQNMRNHATLTVGDRLSVWRRGKEFSLKVVELRPESQATLIDTDMELDLDLPDDAREQLEAQGARERAKTLRAHMDVTPSTTGSPAHSLSPPPRTAGTKAVATGGAMEDSDDDSDTNSEGGGDTNAFDPEQHRLSKLQALPTEPPLGEDGVFTCQLRSPGGRFVRRFRFADELGVLLDFAEAHGGLPGQYRLVVPFPRRVLTREEAAPGMTLRDAGLTSKQESVILEKI